MPQPILELIQSSLKISLRSLAVGAVLFAGNSAFAELKLPAIFGSHMVLQQEESIPVWGWANPGEMVTVTFAGNSVEAEADDQGGWRIDLPTVTANTESQQMIVNGSSGEEVVFEDVLVGEVWICSGQSNMQWPLNRAANASEEIANANFPEIRFFSVKRDFAYEPQSDLTGKWEVCTPGTAMNFSAVGYFFGRHIYNELQQPVGLISTSWGGTVAEAWTSAEALEANLPEFSGKIARLPIQKANLASGKAAANKKYQEAFAALCALEADLESARVWAQPELDDSEWQTMSVPQNWENANYPGFDGMMWYRKTVEIPESWAGRDLTLRPGPIDEVDVTWFNGEPIGSSGNISKGENEFWNQPRDYTVPGESVDSGPNVIAIRVIDATGVGGLWGEDASALYIAPIDGDPGERIPLSGDWRVKPELEIPKPYNPRNPNYPTALYNHMIAPLIPYAIRGAIWYQGESNASRAEQYQTLLPTMIADWRERWGLGDFPFLVVQLANFRKRAAIPGHSSWAELREAQSMTASNDPNVGLALAIDIGEAKDIHPKNKQDVGKRLGLQAQAIAYGQNVVASGPTFADMQIDGNEAILIFDNAEGGLVSNKPNPGSFAIRGETGAFVWADATVEGESVRVSADGIESPVAVRYAWADNPETSLYNQAGLPMEPFRTDVPSD